jgi:hypothetical protein
MGSCSDHGDTHTSIDISANFGVVVRKLHHCGVFFASPFFECGRLLRFLK